MTNYVVNSAVQTTTDNTPAFTLNALDQLFLGRNGLITATGINSAAIDGAPADLYLNGEVFASNSVALHLTGPSVFLDVGPTGTVEALLTAVFIDSGNSEITNHGLIYGNLGIVVSHGGNTVLNFGQINSIGNDAVSLGGAGGDNSNYFENHGTVTGSLAYNGGEVTDQVVNLGTMSGGVQLGAGSDSFDGRNGLLLRGGVSGGDGGDFLSGSQYDDSFSGDSGNDQIFGYAGNDFLFGGDGNDTIDGGAGADILNGGAGTDTVSYATATRGVTADLALSSRNTGDAGGDTCTGIENLKGSPFNDSLIGNAKNNLIDGGTGADRMAGGGGNDIYIAGDAGDTVVERANQGIDRVRSSISYTLANNIENLVLTVSGNINGTGNALANSIIGGSGNNILDGKAGSDILTGGAGRDVFLFDTALNAATNVDTIRDFKPADDGFRLSDVVFPAAGKPGPLPAKAFFAGTAAHDASDRIIYDAGAHRLLYDKDGVGGASAVPFARFTGTPALTSADFFIVA